MGMEAVRGWSPQDKNLIKDRNWKEDVNLCLKSLIQFCLKLILEFIPKISFGQIPRIPFRLWRPIGPCRKVFEVDSSAKIKSLFQ